MASVIRGSDNMDSAQVRPVLMAAQTASGTSVDFTGIPSWVKRITVMFAGVSTNGTSPVRIQLGDSGGVENSGYLGQTVSLGSTALANASNPTAGFDLSAAAAAAVRHGKAEFVLLDGNTWAANGYFGRSDGASAEIFGGSKTLSDVLSSIRITTVNGTDTFDAGTISVMYE